IGLLLIVQLDLVIARRNIPFIWKNPNLKKFRSLIGNVIKLGMINARAGTHYLDFAGSDDPRVPHIVAMLQFPFQGNGNDFHIVMGMLAKSLATLNTIVVQYA